MPSDPAQSPGTPPDDTADGAPSSGAPAEDTSATPDRNATVAASLSSFQGLATGDSSPGRADATADSTISTSGPVELDPARPDPAQVTGVGQTFGRYRIKKVLGSGSMGSVFLAHDPQLNREVALKVPRLERDVAGELSQRLHREARAAATLSHPNICPIFDVTEEGGTCYIAMGYVAGKPLSAYLGKKVQPEREVAKVVRKIALALEEAHAQGIVHRDLKPSNIMIDKRGEPIVMDFGVACWYDDQTQTRLTQQGALVGTPSYMSPEQIEGRTKLGPASDIYSLGVVLYELLTGRCPFQGTVLNVISQVLHQPPPDPRKLRGDLSPELVAIVQRAMQKDRAARYASMRDFAKALTAFINGGARDEILSTETAVATPVERPTPKLERKRRDSEPELGPLPARLSRKPTVKRASKKGIPLGTAVAAAAALVIAGVLIGAYSVGNRTPAKSSGAAQKPLSATEIVSNSNEETRSSSSSAAAEPAPGTTSTLLPSSKPAPLKRSTSVASPKIALAPPEQAGAPSPAGNSPGASATKTPGLSPPSWVSKPAVAQAPPTATNPSSPLRPTASPTIQSAPTSGLAGRNASPGAGPPPKDDSDRPEASPPAGAPPEPNGDGPPPAPRREGGPPRFDGGPKPGVSIEKYFKQLDTNHDGRLDRTELPLHIINRADTNKDGELTLSELKQAYKKRGQKLFSPPTAAEMRRLPRGGPQQFGQGPPGGAPPGGGPGHGPPGSGPPGGGPPGQGNGGL
jgi:serine/threonine-protein kinase